jgi:N-acetylglucosaminyl-diphospho-decaprenol L-rhamnosyltransferase
VNATSSCHDLTGSRAQQAELTIIIVNYESWPDVLLLTASLTAEPAFSSGRCRVVVVDNASLGAAPALFVSPRSGLRLVAQPENSGFAAGVNAGWRVARSPWLLLLNPDVEVAKGFLSRVCTQLDQYTARPKGPPGIVGFALLNSDGSPQGSVGAFPSLARTVWEQFIPRSRRKYQAGWRIRSGPVDWVTGACMLVNAEMMASLGGMDEDFFLYYEEVAFSRAAVSLGWRVEYDASLSVVHRHPLQNRPISPKMRVITRHSKLLYFLKHLPRWQFLGLCMIVRIEATIQRVWSRARRRPEDRRAWQAIGEIASQLRAGRMVRAREIRALAERVAGTGPGADSTKRWPRDWRVPFLARTIAKADRKTRQLRA